MSIADFAFSACYCHGLRSRRCSLLCSVFALTKRKAGLSTALPKAECGATRAIKQAMVIIDNFYYTHWRYQFEL
jgi:hypothetical protein